MIVLPRHLSPWAPHLTLFPEDVALALGPLVVQLSQLVGTAGIDHGRAGTPDGYDGIDRRGSYDRLLASEWLIHDELPDEFLRRAVSGEHAFLRRVFRHEAAARTTVALFDSGGDQLGAPRLAHIAALIVLAQRAERARATLAWGILQESPTSLKTCVTMDTVRGLIESRCKACVDDADIARWLASDGIAGASEVWLVGAESLAGQAPPGRASVLAVADVLEPVLQPETPQRIRVTVSGARGLRPRTIMLDVPAERAAVQLLRDPFTRAVPARVKVTVRADAHSAMVFSSDGRKLYLRTADGGLLTVPIPNSPRAPAGVPVAPRPLGGSVVAVSPSSLNKCPILVCRQGDDAVVHTLSRRGRTVSRTERFGGMLPAEPEDRRLLPLGILAGGRHLCFAGDGDRLIVLSGGRVTTWSSNPVAASRATDNAFFYVERTAPATVKMLQSNQKGELEETLAGIELPPPHAATRYFFGGSFGYGELAVMAWSAAASRCTLVKRRQTETFDVPRTHRAIGMVLAKSGSGPGVMSYAVAIDGSRTAVELLRSGERRHLFATTAPITSAAASDHSTTMIAFITEAGEIGIYSTFREAMLLHLAPQEPS